MAPNSILMVLVDLDVNQIVGYHYFDHHQPSRGSSVRLRALIFNWIIMNFLGSFGALSCFGKNKNAAEPSIGAVHAAPLPLDN